jgi:predicted histidine transporter YuiF (NhaC family)
LNATYATGLRQGDTLFPVLFNLVLNQVIKDMHEKQEMELIEINTLLAYADDLVILGLYFYIFDKYRRIRKS